MCRHNVTITLIDDAGNPGPSWNLINAWPVGYTVPDLNGLGGEVAIQSLELCHEGLEHIAGRRGRRALHRSNQSSILSRPLPPVDRMRAGSAPGIRCAAQPAWGTALTQP